MILMGDTTALAQAHDKKDDEKSKDELVEELTLLSNNYNDVISRHNNDNVERKRAEEELQRANRALKALSKCKEAMIRAEDEPSLLNDICTIVVDVGGYRLAWIGYIESDEMRTVRPVARAGYDEGYVDNLKIALNDPIRGNGPTGISLKTGKPYGSRDVESDVVMQPWRLDAIKRGYISTLNLPIMYEKQILGALVIYSGRPGAFDEEELELLWDLAENLAYGIATIRDRVRRDQVEKELQRAKEELEVRVEERTEELKLAKAQAELYLDLLSHDINNMLQVALGYLELAQDMLELDHGEKELITRPYETLLKSSRLIDNVRKLQKSNTGEIKEQIMDLEQVLSNVISEYEGLPDKYIHERYKANGRCPVKANLLINDVFSNLIGNAIKHPNGDNVDISINLDTVRDNGYQYYKVSIEDNGPGIPDDMKDRIFYRAQRGLTNANGMGLGLYLVKSLVDSYNGKVWVEDRVNGDHTKGSRFVVMLPAIEN